MSPGPPRPGPGRRGHLSGARIRLRPPAPEDLPQLFRWMNDPEAIAPWDRFEVDSYEGMAQALRDAPSDPRSLAPRFVVMRRDDERPLGVVGYYLAHNALDTVDLWYAICLPEERGKGYGAEAVGLLTDFVFSQQKVSRVGAVADVENPASYHLLERLGFSLEGRMRQALFHHGQWHDVVVYGLTREEWERKVPTPTGPAET